MKIVKLILLSLVMFFGAYSNIKFDEVDKAHYLITQKIKHFDAQFYATLRSDFGGYGMEFSMISWAADVIVLCSFILIVIEIVGLFRKKSAR